MDKFSNPGKLPWDMEEALAKDALRREELAKRRQDDRVCWCGHVPRAHYSQIPGLTVMTDAHGRVIESCHPGRQDCPCMGFGAVLRVSSARYFMRKTAGYGPDHALGIGLTRLLGDGGSFEFLPETVCRRCEKHFESYIPVGIDPMTMAVAREPAKANFLFCEGCFDVLCAGGMTWANGLNTPIVSF